MLDPNVVKRIMNSFHCMKDHINNIEKEYSKLIEKRKSYCKEKESNNFVNLQSE